MAVLTNGYQKFCYLKKMNSYFENYKIIKKSKKK